MSIMSLSTVWPPPSGLTTHQVPRKDAVFQIYSSTHIAAPASLVFEVLLHVAEYEKWNTWIPKARITKQDIPEDPSANPSGFGPLRQNTIFKFFVIMDAKKPQNITETGLQVTDVSTPGHPSEYVSKEILEHDGSFTADLSRVYRVSWATHGGFLAKGLRSERFHEVIMLGENECEVRTWEVMGGILAHTVKWMFQKTLEGKFSLWVSDLKQWSEKRQLEGASL